MSEDDVTMVAEYADILQIGTRNMENYSLLEAAARSGRPVLLKRGMVATIADLLRSAQLILDNGNPNVLLCERGIRTCALSRNVKLTKSAFPNQSQSTFESSQQQTAISERGLTTASSAKICFIDSVWWLSNFLHFENDAMTFHYFCNTSCASTVNAISLRFLP